MGKKWLMYILFTTVASGVATVGSLDCKKKPEDQRQILVVQHPDSCYLMEPKSITDGQSTSVDVVSVAPGKNTFKFDCNGKEIEIQKDVKAGESMWTPSELK